MNETTATELVLYGKPGCGLCDETRELLKALLARRTADGLPSPELVERDIRSDPALEAAYGSTIPVLEVAGQTLELAIGGAVLRRFLAEALDDRVPGPTG
jgi:glutaredoxin